MKTPSLRFSLRFLLLASALIPLAGYWLALPTLHAQRFAAAVAGGDYAAAEKLCVDRRKPFPGPGKSTAFSNRDLPSRS
ncbi:MAG: hypothetical protein L0211_16295 [Planctomycetaceae bacterium]|nr:hypothetical protein [Planctomycetaceae bacterium]